MKDLTQGSVTKHLLHMSAFMAVSMVVQTLYLLLDMYWVGHLGKQAIAAVGRSWYAARRMARPADPFALGDGPDACLLLHGLTGSPAEMRPVGEALAGAGFRAVGPVLPGHGTTPVDLYGVTRGDVIRAAESALLSLRGARRIFLCGLSMGSLLVIHLAARSSPTSLFHSPSIPDSSSRSPGGFSMRGCASAVRGLMTVGSCRSR